MTRFRMLRALPVSSRRGSSHTGPRRRCGRCCSSRPPTTAYRLVRGWIDDPRAPRSRSRTRATSSRSSARWSSSSSPRVQAWIGATSSIGDFASWIYINAQISVTLGALVFLYLFHNRSFYFVRNMFMVAMGDRARRLRVFPTAPPRFFPEWGFVDTVSDFTGVQPRQRHRQRALQPLRRRPVDARRFALMIGVPLARLVKHRVDAGRSGRVPAAGDVRDRRDRQPLPARRRPRRADRGASPPRRDVARAAAARVGFAPARARHGLMSSRREVRDAPPRADARRARQPGERRELMRNALIESRLTPNAISLTGLVLCVVAAVLVWQELLLPRRRSRSSSARSATRSTGATRGCRGKGTPFGAFLDSTLDRIEEGIVLTAVAYTSPSDGQDVAAARLRDRRARVADGVLHPRPRRGARRRVQGRHRQPRGPRRRSCRSGWCSPKVLGLGDFELLGRVRLRAGGAGHRHRRCSASSTCARAERARGGRDDL